MESKCRQTAEVAASREATPDATPEAKLVHVARNPQVIDKVAAVHHNTVTNTGPKVDLLPNQTTAASAGSEVGLELMMDTQKVGKNPVIKKHLAHIDSAGEKIPTKETQKTTEEIDPAVNMTHQVLAQAERENGDHNLPLTTVEEIGGKILIVVLRDNLVVKTSIVPVKEDTTHQAQTGGTGRETDTQILPPLTAAVIEDATHQAQTGDTGRETDTHTLPPLTAAGRELRSIPGKIEIESCSRDKQR